MKRELLKSLAPALHHPTFGGTLIHFSRVLAADKENESLLSNRPTLILSFLVLIPK